jgi:hypothetical protein
MGRFTVYLLAQRAVRFPVNICDWEGMVSYIFCHYGELNVLVDTVWVVREAPHPDGTVDLYEENVIHVVEAAEDHKGCPFEHILLEVFHDDVSSDQR